MIRRVLCISWDGKLAREREQLFEDAGCLVRSAVGPQAEELVENEDGDLLVLGHSVPREEKRRFIRIFRRHSSAPVLSLLVPGQERLPEATLGFPGDDYRNLATIVRHIVQ